MKSPAVQNQDRKGAADRTANGEAGINWQEDRRLL